MRAWPKGLLGKLYFPCACVSIWGGQELSDLYKQNLMQGNGSSFTPSSERRNTDSVFFRRNNDISMVKDWFFTPGAEKELISSMEKLKMAKPRGQSSKAQAKTKAYLLEEKMKELNLNEEEAAKQIGWQDHEAWELEKAARPAEMTMEDFARRFRSGEEVDGSAMESGEGEMEEGYETGDDWEAEEEGRLQVQEAARRNVPVKFK